MCQSAHRLVASDTPEEPSMCISLLNQAMKKPRPKPGLNEDKGLLCEERARVVLDQNLKVVFSRPPNTLLVALYAPPEVFTLPS